MDRRLVTIDGNEAAAYVAHRLGTNDNQTVQAFAEAESYDGSSILIAYAHCIAPGSISATA